MDADGFRRVLLILRDPDNFKLCLSPVMAQAYIKRTQVAEGANKSIKFPIGIIIKVPECWRAGEWPIEVSKKNSSARWDEIWGEIEERKFKTKPLSQFCLQSVLDLGRTSMDSVSGKASRNKLQMNWPPEALAVLSRGNQIDGPTKPSPFNVVEEGYRAAA